MKTTGLEGAINAHLNQLGGVRKVTMCSLSWIYEEGTPGSATFLWVEDPEILNNDLANAFAAMMHATSVALEDQAEEAQDMLPADFIAAAMMKAINLKIASAQGRGRTIKVRQDNPPEGPPRSSRFPPQSPPG